MKNIIIILIAIFHISFLHAQNIFLAPKTKIKKVESNVSFADTLIQDKNFNFGPIIIGDQIVFRYFHKGANIPSKVEFASIATTWEHKTMNKIGDNLFYISLPLENTYRHNLSRVEYKFIVDGQWINDPKNLYKNPDDTGNSYINLRYTKQGQIHIVEDYLNESDTHSYQIRQIICNHFDFNISPNIFIDIISKSIQAIEPLKAALFSSSDIVRHNAIRCLGLMRTKESIKLLSNHIKADFEFKGHNKLDRDKWIYDANLITHFLSDNLLFEELGLHSLFVNRDNYIKWAKSNGAWKADLDEELKKHWGNDYASIIDSIKTIYGIFHGPIAEYKNEAWEPMLKYGKTAFLPLKLLLANNHYRSAGANILWCIAQLYDNNNDEDILDYLFAMEHRSTGHLSSSVQKLLLQINHPRVYEFALAKVKKSTYTMGDDFFNPARTLAFSWYDKIKNDPILLLKTTGIGNQEYTSKVIARLKQILKNNFFSFIRMQLRNENSILKDAAMNALIVRNTPEDYENIVKSKDRVSILIDILREFHRGFKNELQIMITHRCPFNCAHCVAKEVLKNPESIKDMDFSVLLSLINELFKVNAFFSGGEPFAYHQNSSKKPSQKTYQLLNFSSQVTKTHVITNAYFFPDSEEECYNFLDTLPDGLTLVVSLDKAHEIEMEKKRKNIYDIVKFIENYRNKRKRIDIHYSIRLFTSDTLAERIEILSKYGLIEAYNQEHTRFHINNIIEQGGAADTDFKTQVTEKGWAEESDFHINNLKDDDILEHNRLHNAILYVKPNGDIVTSAHAGFMVSPPPSTIIGNISRNNLFEILLNWIISELKKHDYTERNYLLPYLKNLKIIYSTQDKNQTHSLNNTHALFERNENGLTSAQIEYLEALKAQKGMATETIKAGEITKPAQIKKSA